MLPSEQITSSALPLDIYLRGSITSPFRITAYNFSVLRLIHFVTSMYPRTRYEMGGIPFSAELASAS